MPISINMVFVGIMLEWIREGMKENIEDLVRMIGFDTSRYSDYIYS